MFSLYKKKKTKKQKMNKTLEFGVDSELMERVQI